jgi:MFS superfamily sulfate permease-like transporter
MAGGWTQTVSWQGLVWPIWRALWCRACPSARAFRQGSAAEAAGAATRVAAVVAALALAGLVFLAGPVMEHLPQPVLAAVVIGTLAHALSFAPFVRFWRLRRDFWLAVATAVAVLGLGVLNGMLLSVALSLAGLLASADEPETGAAGDVERQPGLCGHGAPPRCAGARGRGDLAAGGAPVLRQRGGGAGQQCAGCEHAKPGARAIVLSLEETFDLDTHHA